MKFHETQFGRMSARYEKQTNKTVVLWYDIDNNFRCFEYEGKIPKSRAIDLFLRFIFSGGLKKQEHIQTFILE